MVGPGPLARLRALFARPEAPAVPSEVDVGLVEAWAVVEDDLRQELEQLLLHRLLGVMARGVPISAFQPGPVEGVVRLRFADGLTVLVSPSQPGQCSRLAMDTFLGHRVVLSDVQLTDDGVRMTMGRTWALRTRVLGFDQDD